MHQELDTTQSQIEEHSVDWSDNTVYRLNDGYVKQVLTELESNRELVQKGSEEKSSGQKSYTSESMTNVAVTPGRVWAGPNNQLLSTRFTNWYKEGDQIENEGFSVPDYSVSSTSVAVRPIVADRLLINDTEPQSYGHELEFVVVRFMEDGSVLPIDIQNILNELGNYEFPAISPEAWSSQMEYPSLPRNGEIFAEHRKRISDELNKILFVFNALDLDILPVGVVPFGGTEQANLSDPHISHTIQQGIQPFVDTDITQKDAAEMLNAFRTNGLHITIKLQRDENGLVGDERLNNVFNMTHGPIAVMMKAFSLNGNLLEEDLLEGNLSSREKHRNQLPTGKVGEVYRLSDYRTRKNLLKGNAPTPERGAMSAGPHHPIGRQKESGMIEYTIFDMETSQIKVHQLEIMLREYTRIVDHHVLHDSVDDLYNSVPEEYRNVFLGIMNDQEEFFKLASAIDKDGFNAQIELENEEIRDVGKILKDFFVWIHDQSSSLGPVEEDTTWALTALHWSIPMQDFNGFDSYADYISTGYGNTAMTTQKVYAKYFAETGDYQIAMNLTLKELALAWKNQDLVKSEYEEN